MIRDELPGLRRLPVGPLTIEGFSRSTVATFFHIRELGILLDAGACPGSAAAAADAFVSHLHVDHAQALPYYASRRNMLRMPPGRIHVPAGTGAAVRGWIDGFASLQGPGDSAFVYELVEMAPGDSWDLRGRHVVRAFATDHRVPSLGFTVFERRQKLLPLYADLSGEEIGRRKRRGEEVTRTVEIPVLTYLGDTAPTALDRHPEIGESEVLVVECTFLAPEHVENARETRHLHLWDLAERAALLRNRFVVLTHFSMRYNDAWIRETVRRTLPQDLHDRVRLLL